MPSMLNTLNEGLTNMAECNGAMMRITLLNQNMTIEATHLRVRKDTNTHRMSEYQQVEPHL